MGEMGMVTPSQALTAFFAEMESQRGLVETWFAGRPGDDRQAIELLIHVTAWQENALKTARAQAQPDAPDLDPRLGPAKALNIDFNVFNDEHAASHREWTRDQALDWYRQVHADLLNALRALPAERLLGGTGPHGARMWFARPTLIHHQDHLKEMEPPGAAG